MSMQQEIFLQFHKTLGSKKLENNLLDEAKFYSSIKPNRQSL